VTSLTGDLVNCETAKNATQDSLDTCTADLNSCQNPTAPEYAISQPTSCDPGAYWIVRLNIKFGEAGNTRLPTGISVCQSDNEVIFNLENGELRRSGVGIGGPNDNCDTSTLVCAGGSMHGWAGQIYVEVLKSLTRVDYLHPNSPQQVCTPAWNDWWKNEAVTKGYLTTEQVDNQCIMSDGHLLIVNADGSRTRSCVGGWENTNNVCPSDRMYVCPTFPEFQAVPGWPNLVLGLVGQALSQGGRLSLCPFEY